MHDLCSHKTCILITETNWSKYRITTGCCGNRWKYTMEEAKVRRQETQSDKNKNKSRVCGNTSCGGHPDLAHIVDQSCIWPQCNMPITKVGSEQSKKETNEDFQLVTPPFLSCLSFHSSFSSFLIYSSIRITPTHKYFPYTTSHGKTQTWLASLLSWTDATVPWK